MPSAQTKINAYRTTRFGGFFGTLACDDSFVRFGKFDWAVRIKFYLRINRPFSRGESGAPLTARIVRCR
jgi:hypothetical protein